MKKKRVIHLTETELRNVIRESIKREAMNEGWKQAAVGGLMGLGVMMGSPSCSNQMMNNAPQTEYSEQEVENWYLYPNKGKTIEASVCVIKNKDYIKDLQLNTRQCKSMGAIHFEWGRSNNVPTFAWATERGDTLIDVYAIEQVVNNNVDASCHIELCYSKDTNLSMEERAICLKVYHNEQDRDETEFTISLNTLKRNGGSRYYIDEER